MTIQETSEIMDVLNTAYPNFYAKQSNRERLKAAGLWASMFSNMPLKVVIAAVKAYIATDSKGFPPTIGEIMEKCRKIMEPDRLSEAEAWALVRRALRNSAYNSREEFKKLPPEVKKIVHAPEQLRAWAIDEHFNEGVESSNFKRAFRSVMEQEHEFNALPPDVKKLAVEMGAKLSADKLLEKE